jgi:transcriptional regulator with XRE-family HTH domain
MGKAIDEQKRPASEPATIPQDPAIPGLTEEQAKVILKSDLANIVRKVKSGKTLSASERALLATATGNGKPTATRFVDTQAELADAIGVNRKSIARWRKVEGNPGAQPDGRYNVADWIAFKQQMTDEDDDPSWTELKARHLALQVQKIEHHLAVVRREYVPAAEVERWGAELGAAIRKVVAQIHLVAPSVVGVSVPEAEARLKEIEQEVLQQLHLLADAAREYRPRTDDEPAA